MVCLNLNAESGRGIERCIEVISVYAKVVLKLQQGKLAAWPRVVAVELYQIWML